MTVQEREAPTGSQLAVVPSRPIGPHADTGGRVELVELRSVTERSRKREGACRKPLSTPRIGESRIESSYPIFSAPSQPRSRSLAFIRINKFRPREHTTACDLGSLFFDMQEYELVRF